MSELRSCPDTNLCFNSCSFMSATEIKRRTSVMGIRRCDGLKGNNVAKMGFKTVILLSSVPDNRSDMYCKKNNVNHIKQILLILI